jgi:hypothetical protein
MPAGEENQIVRFAATQQIVAAAGRVGFKSAFDT